jgi:hypothetical protein
MSWMPIEWPRWLTPHQASQAPFRLRMAGAAVRAVFIACVLLITLRVSMPQNETILTAYDSPGDLVRIGLGLAICLWLVVQLFRAPSDAHAYRAWLYFGLAAIPFALICLVFIW